MSQKAPVLKAAPAYRTLGSLLAAVRDCRACAAQLPLGPRPVLSATETARILLVGQAPGLRVHMSGIPWDDRSGERLRGWMEVGKDVFYDESRIAIIPMGYCYPGRGKGGDMPPHMESAEHRTDEDDLTFEGQIEESPIEVDTSEDNGLPDDFVRSLHVDANGSLWVGTRRGLTHWQGAPAKQQMETYTQATGLGNDLVGAMARDYTVVIPVDTTSAASGYETTIGFYNVLNSGNANLANEPLKPRAVTLTRTDLITFQ